MCADCGITEIAEEVAAAGIEAASGDGAILFACTAHARQINPLLSIAGELSRRDVPGLWFAATDNRRLDIEEAAKCSPIQFVSTGISDRTKELVADSVVYSAFTQKGPMNTRSFLLALRWMFNQERLATEYEWVLEHIDRIQPSLMVIDISTTGAIDAAITRRIPFILSVPFTPSGSFMDRLPWDYPLPGSGLPRRMKAGQKVANLWYRLRLLAAMFTRFPFSSLAQPLLVMPFWLDCFDFAARAVDSGVGLALDHPPSFTANEVVEKLRRLLKESSFCERAQYWGEQLRKAGGTGRAADLVLTASTERRR